MNESARRWFAQSLDAIEGRSRQRGEAASSPVERYFDVIRHGRERRALRGLPLAVAPSAHLRSAGDWVTRDVHGVPVLALRDVDGALRAYLNVCRHRGAELLPPGQRGSGRGSRIVCPYHSWTYAAPDGCLVGRPHEAEFPQRPRAEAGLVPLPVTERLGLVWVVADAAASVDWSRWFGPFGAELEALGYDRSSACPHERRFEQGSNWKLVFDGNLETYHFQYAHRTTIAELFHDNLLVHEAAGDHQRLVLPKRGLSALDATSLDIDQLGRHCNVLYLFFPATLLLWEGDHLNGFAVSPRAEVDRAGVEGWLIAPDAMHRRRQPEHWQQNHDLFWRALDEDFALAASIQRGLASGANRSLAFGTSEFGAELFERAVERLIG